MSIPKAPSCIRGDSGLLSSGRFSRTYCANCQQDELHHSMVCVQCKRGGIPMTPIEFHWNGKRRS